MGDVLEFRMPDLGEGLEEGEIAEWHVHVGDVIKLNDVVASVETAKALVEVPSPFAGTVVELLGEPGDVLEVGSVMLRVEAARVRGPDATSDLRTAVDAGAEEAERATARDVPPGEGDRPKTLVGYGARIGRTERRSRVAGPQALMPVDTAVLAKPPVRLLARNLGVDLREVEATGPGGTISRDDVRRLAENRDRSASDAPDGYRQDVAAHNGPARPETAQRSGIPGFRGRHPGQVETVTGIRRRIVAKMESSRREIPHALCSREADLTALWELRHVLTAEAASQGLQARITPTVVVMRAVAVALRRFPTLNARYSSEKGQITLLEPIHLGCAVDTDRGLMVPVVRDAHRKTLVQLALETERLAASCRDGTATPSELTGGTFTVDNYGSFGNDDGNPIINAPEAAILGIGAIRERPWVVDGRICVRRVGRLTLGFDHRVCDGGEAGRFVTFVADLCEEPTRILLHA